MEQWKKYKLSDICDLIAGFAFKSIDFGTEGVSVVKIKDIQPPFVNLDNADKVNLSAYDIDKLKKFLISKGDFLLAMTGATIGKIGKYISNEQSYLNQRVLKFLPKQQVDSKFLYYSLLTHAFQLYILNHIDSDSAQPNISANTIGKYELSIPCIKTQKRIADILSTFDNKIELNRRINDNLEQQAQTLFKAWFIDNAVFGDATVSDYFIPLRGKNFLTSDAKGGKFPVVAGGLMPSAYHNVANTQAPVITISASGANAGYVNLWCIPVWSADSSYIDNTITPYVYFWFNLLKFNQKSIYDSQTGSAQPHIYPKHIGDIRIPDLNINQVAEFDKIVTPIYSQIAKLRKSNAQLAETRDTLLPKLMSEELKINDLIC